VTSWNANAASASRFSPVCPKRQAEVVAKQQELDKLREELAEVRKDLFRQYQERRDRLAGLQQAVQTAAKKVQDRKLELDSTEQTTADVRADLTARQAAAEQRKRIGGRRPRRRSGAETA